MLASLEVLFYLVEGYTCVELISLDMHMLCLGIDTHVYHDAWNVGSEFKSSMQLFALFFFVFSICRLLSSFPSNLSINICFFSEVSMFLYYSTILHLLARLVMEIFHKTMT